MTHTGTAHRPVEWRAVCDVLDAAAHRPAGLLMEGEAGIGKSTLLFAGVDEAKARGFRVLTTQSSAVESVLAYAALADLLRSVDDAEFDDLPEVQRVALDRALLRSGADGRPSDQGEVAAALLTVLERLVEQGPVLVAMDDLQWTDASSRKAVGFALRRLTGRVGFLGAVRVGPDADDAAWLQVGPPDALSRVSLRPMSLAAIHTVLADRLGYSPRRPTLVRIFEVSGGNPFYAIELARAVPRDQPGPLQLPTSLADLVRSRIAALDAVVQEVLFAAACLAAPTVDLVAAATGHDEDHVFEVLQQAELHHIVAISGHRIRFEHPLLAVGVYGSASTARRRAVHRRLATLVTPPELRARHLALSATHGDPTVLDALDTAADLALKRGAPASAAELFELATDLGGDTPDRRLASARCYFSAGDALRARTILTDLATGPASAGALSLLGVIEILEGSLAAAAEMLGRALEATGSDSALRVQILVPLSLALFNTGRRGMAALRGDEAVRIATELGEAALLTQAVSMRALLGCWMGQGIDDVAMRRTAELVDTTTGASVLARPDMHRAMLLSFAGRLDEADAAMTEISGWCSDRGAESEHVFVLFHHALLKVWRGMFDEAGELADDALVRANMLDGELPRGVATTMRASVAAYAGRPEEARSHAVSAQESLSPSGSQVLAAWPRITLGFLEVSLGDHAAALDVLAPLLASYEPDATEIFVAAFLPDAVESLVALDRIDEATPLVDALERNGTRLNRPWMLAVGARGRAHVLAGRGDLVAATCVAEQAMAHHDRLPMPFERARTQVLLGQLLRRQRRKDAATATLREAVAAFEALGTPLWEQRARAELRRADVAHGTADELTPSERRVAELAAGGLSNRDIAKQLFISPKTVESNLARVYRKLEIHSRNQLARHLPPPE